LNIASLPVFVQFFKDDRSVLGNISVRYVLRIGAIVAVIASAGLLLLPEDWAPRQWLFAAQDPASVATRNFRSMLTPESINAELKSALDNKDKHLADSFIELARQENIAVDPALRERYDRETSGFTAPVERLVQGLWDGKCSSFESFAGGQLGDLLSIGDVRDLYNQAGNYRNGRPTDPLVIGLATVGIVSTALLPFHAATSMIKGLAKAQRLSPGFRRELTDALASGLDTEAVLKAVPQFSWWDSLPGIGWDTWHPDLSWPLVTEKLPQLVGALSSGVQLGKLGTFNQLAGNVVSLTSNAGVCGAQDALALAQGSADLKRLTRLAEQRKGATAAVLKLHGRDALQLPA
jgi:hypothetical protein